MNTLDYIVKKYKFDLTAKSPIEIPNVGRSDLALWLQELNFKTGVEVGVAAGEYGEILCQTNPQMKLYGIDPWKPYKGYSDYTKISTFTSLYQQAVDRLALYPNYIFLKEFSAEALKKFDDESLDFVYIDANHQEPFISEDIAGWSRKVRPGGIVAGHDYITRKLPHFDVKDAVLKYVNQYQIRPWFILGSGAKIAGTIRESSRSWMWIKS